MRRPIVALLALSAVAAVAIPREAEADCRVQQTCWYQYGRRYCRNDTVCTRTPICTVVNRCVPQRVCSTYYGRTTCTYRDVCTAQRVCN